MLIFVYSLARCLIYFRTTWTLYNKYSWYINLEFNSRGMILKHQWSLWQILNIFPEFNYFILPPGFICNYYNSRGMITSQFSIRINVLLKILKHLRKTLYFLYFSCLTDKSKLHLFLKEQVYYIEQNKSL